MNPNVSASIGYPAGPPLTKATYPSWVKQSGWTTIYDWMHGGNVDAHELHDELKDALKYCGGTYGHVVNPTKGTWRWPPK